MAAAKLLLHLLNAACLEYQKLGKDRKRGRGRREYKSGRVWGVREREMWWLQSFLSTWKRRNERELID